LSNSSIHFNLTYELGTDPSILQDSGNFSFGYDNLTLHLIFGMYPLPGDDKKLQIEITENTLVLNPNDVDLNVNNTNDFNKMVLEVVNVLKFRTKIAYRPSLL
jgi:hypothetical protein